MRHSSLVPPVWEAGWMFLYQDVESRTVPDCPVECPAGPPPQTMAWRVDALEEKAGYATYRIVSYESFNETTAQTTLWLDRATLGVVAFVRQSRTGEPDPHAPAYQFDPPIHQVFPIKDREYESRLAGKTLRAGTEVGNTSFIVTREVAFEAVELKVWTQEMDSISPRVERSLWYAPEPGVFVQMTPLAFPGTSKEVLGLVSKHWKPEDVRLAQCVYGWSGRVTDSSMYEYLTSQGPFPGYNLVVEPPGYDPEPHHGSYPGHATVTREANVHPGNYSLSLDAHGHETGPAILTVSLNPDSPRPYRPSDEQLNAWRAQVYQELGLPDPMPVAFDTQSVC